MTFRTGALRQGPLRLAYAERSKTYVYNAVLVLGTLYLTEGWGESGVTGNRKFCRIRSRLVGKPWTIAEIPLCTPRAPNSSHPGEQFVLP
jgi:hypothetical protein